MCFWVSWQCFICAFFAQQAVTFAEYLTYVRGIWGLQDITVSIFPFELYFIEILGGMEAEIAI